ncbi:MAG TPA: 3-oxoadipyl-CoA thiolase, partial [Alcanivorax sp.]|nr:3-oxoadipyl-CoA thiolase [Alcanivorax sp.]
MLDAYIYDGLRTPFGRHAGALAPVRPDDLLADVIRALIARNPFDPALIEDVVAGNTNQAGEDARNVARHAALLAGLPESVAGLTVNRLCGSGLAATLDAARMVTVDEGQLVIAGGVESMSRAPFVMAKAESPYSRSMPMFDSTIGARFPNPKILKQFGGDTMPETAQNVASDLGISREQADAYAAQSQRRYEDARVDGFFKEEILPVEVPQGRKKPPLSVSEDEHPRPGTGVDKLAKLPA